MKEINIRESRATTRMGHLPIEGGGLNASYTTVDAIANICATAGNLGLKYGKDFIWAGTGYIEDDDMEECVTLLVKEEKYETFLQLAIQNDHKIKHTNNGDVKLTKERK
mgnify:FL=1|jgi:hypothetical protein|tara:strand:- start:2146 stop:2472 length:327 start_codon:yes stop_codon:yes gene_type:complete